VFVRFDHVGPFIEKPNHGTMWAAVLLRVRIVGAGGTVTLATNLRN